MNAFVVMMSNVRPQAQSSGGNATSQFEAMYPEQNPRWHFLTVDRFAGAHVADGATAASLPLPESDGEASLALRAIPRGRRIGGEVQGPVAMWVVLANAVEGRDAEFNDWYDNRHIHDVVDLPGVISGQRFTLVPIAEGQPLPWKYLALYEVEHDRVAESLAELVVRRGTARMPNPGYLAPGALMTTYQPTN